MDAAGAIISHQNLAAHAKAKNPVGWPLAEFCGYVTDKRAGLEDFLLSNVSPVRLCKARTHEYVVLKVECAHLYHEDIWIKCERRPSLIRIASMPFQELRAPDTVTISFQDTKVSQAPQNKSMETQGLQFSDVVVLWRVIEENSSLFKLSSLSSSWFASVIWENLTQMFPTEPTFTTRDDLLRRIVRSVGSNRPTQAVTRMFLAKSRVRLEPTTLGDNRAGSDGSISMSDRNSLFSSPRGKASPLTPMNYRNQISPPTKGWGDEDGGGPRSVPEGGKLYESPESFSMHPELPRSDDITAGASSQANYLQLPELPIDDSPHTARASQSTVQYNEQPHLDSYVSDNALGILLPPSPGRHDLKHLQVNYEEEVKETPRPLPRNDHIPPALPTGTTWAALIGELRQASDVEDLSGQFDHTHRRWVAAGGYSEVYLTYWRVSTQTNPVPVCYKALRPINDLRPANDAAQKVIKRLRREMRSWKNLKHPNVLRFIGFAIENESYGTITAALVSEWRGHGHVIKYLGQNSMVNRQMLVSDVARGLEYLHSQDPPIVHGDVKPQNILVTDTGRAQLCDFGLSRVLDGSPSGNTTSGQAGTLRYLAPELLGGSASNEEMRPTTKSDVFAFACTCIEILFDHQPYHWHKTDYLVMKAIERHEAPWQWGDNPLERILASCCSQSDFDRPSMLRFMAILSTYLPNY